MKRIANLAFFLLILTGLAGCFSSATLKTRADKSMESESIKSVAILPIQGANLPPGENREFTKAVIDAFREKNNAISVLGPSESMELINAKGLSNHYNELLRSYISTGAPSEKYIKEIGAALNVDALLQGVVLDVRQSEASFYQFAGSHLTLSYGLMSVKSGIVIWDATSRARKQEAWSWSSAPPLYETISVALQEILPAIPKLNK